MPHLKSLNPKQRQAASILDGPALVLAGAGSGKTRVVTARMIHLIQSGVHPSKILGLTFTNQAAEEMKLRVNQQTQANVLICTFHSLGARILRESIEHLGFTSHFVIYDEDDSSKLLEKCLEEAGIKEKKGDLRAWRALISKAKNDLLDPDDVNVDSLNAAYQGHFPAVYRAYVSACRACNAVDFDDLLFLPLQLLKEKDALRNMYQERWSHLLIDEYQDTNEAQYALVKFLVEKSKNIFVVGDPDQAIYSWRGANIRNILDFEKDYPGADVVLLEQNYRSTTTILKAANALISNNESRYEKKLWSDLGVGSKIGRFSAFNDREEARFVANKIRAHRQKDQISCSDMVVFYRTNAQSRPFEDQLLSLGIPYTIVGGISFYQRKEIKDILAYLRLIVSDQDEIAFMRVLNVPKRGIGSATLSKLLKGASETSLPILAYCRDALHKGGLTAKAKQGINELLELIKNLRVQAQECSIQQLVKALIEQSKYLDYLKEDKETHLDRKENLDELVRKAREWDLCHDHPHLTSFLEELSLKSSLDEASIDQERVNLMTVHNGKGLEFRVAFVVGLEEDLFPHINSKDNPEQLEEERRLCYVGVTRAKEHLYLTDSQVRYLWGVERYQRPSRFLKEIPAELLQRVHF